MKRVQIEGTVIDTDKPRGKGDDKYQWIYVRDANSPEILSVSAWDTLVNAPALKPGKQVNLICKERTMKYGTIYNVDRLLPIT